MTVIKGKSKERKGHMNGVLEKRMKREEEKIELERETDETGRGRVFQ